MTAILYQDIEVKPSLGLATNYFFLKEENRDKILSFLDSLAISNSVIPNRISSDSSSIRQSREKKESYFFEENIKKLAVFYALHSSFNSNNPELSLAESKLLVILGYDKSLLEKEMIIEEGGQPLTPLAFAIKSKNFEAVKLLINFGVNLEHPSVKKQIKNLLNEEVLSSQQLEVNKAICKVFLNSGMEIDLQETEEVDRNFVQEKQDFIAVKELFFGLRNQEIFFQTDEFREIFINALKEFNSFDGENRVRNLSSFNDLNVNIVLKNKNGIEQNFSINNLFLKKILDQAIIEKPLCLGCCSLFARLSQKQTLKEFLTKDHQGKDELSKFLTNSQIAKMLQEQVRNSISSEHKGSHGSKVHSRQPSLEFRNAHTGFSLPNSRSDIFDFPEGGDQLAPQTNPKKPDPCYVEVAGVSGVVRVGNRDLDIPASDPHSPSVNARSAPLNRTSHESYKNL